MTTFDDDKYKKNRIIANQDPDDDSESGRGTSGGGGKSGQVEFHDFLAEKPSRDDLLSPSELKRILAVHNSTHELRVKEQKDRRDNYQTLKNGKASLQNYRNGVANAGNASPYKMNPELANKAQFSGRDRQVTNLPTDYIADTNNEKKEELRLQHSLQNKLEYTPAPKFNPKPTPR